MAHNTALQPRRARTANPIRELVVSQSIKVKIYDQTYNVAGDLEPGYVEELAQYVDAQDARDRARDRHWWIR